jgi:hypothetical protein
MGRLNLLHIKKDQEAGMEGAVITLGGRGWSQYKTTAKSDLQRITDLIFFVVFAAKSIKVLKQK